MAAIEDMHRDRMLFLDLTSDPGSSATERDFANNVLKNEFTPGVQNKIFAAYQTRYLKAKPVRLRETLRLAPPRLFNRCRLRCRFFRQ